MRLARIAYAPLATAMVLLSATPTLAQFQSNNVSITPGGSTAANINNNFSDIINQGFIIFTWIAGIAAVFFLLYSGFQYITAGGDGDKAGKARTGIINAIIGIIVLMSAFFIFRAARNVGSGVTNGNVGTTL